MLEEEGEEGGEGAEDGTAVKFVLVALEPLTDKLCVGGLKVNPVLLGVTAYDPFARPVKL
jgi:hypothetical protein